MTGSHLSLPQIGRDSLTTMVTPVASNSSAVPDDMRSKENRLTRISLCIVWLFIFCHVWKLVPTFYEGWHSNVKAAAQWPRWLNVINDISHTLIVFNSAVNFLIYAVL